MTTILNTHTFQQGILAELVGKDEKIDQNKFSGSAGFDINQQQKGGVITSVSLIQTVEGTGGLLSVTGEILFFLTDPNPTANADDLTAAQWQSCIGKLTVSAADWVSGAANGQIAYYKDVGIPFPFTANLYVVFKLTSATSINSLAADDEVLDIHIIYGNYDK